MLHFLGPDYQKWVIFDILRYNFFLFKKISIENKTKLFWAQIIQNGQNLKSMIFMEKS